MKLALAGLSMMNISGITMVQNTLNLMGNLFHPEFRSPQ